MAEKLESQRERRKQVLRRLHLKLSDLEDAYALLQWCDRCSLILVRDEIPAMQRRIEITRTLFEKPSNLWRDDDEHLHVEPWPFETQEVKVGVEVRQLDQLQFKNDEELEEHLEHADITFREWTFRG